MIACFGHVLVPRMMPRMLLSYPRHSIPYNLWQILDLNYTRWKAAENEACSSSVERRWTATTLFCNCAPFLFICCRRMKKSRTSAAMLCRSWLVKLQPRFSQFVFAFCSAGVFVRKKNWKTRVLRNRCIWLAWRAAAILLRFMYLKSWSILVDRPILFLYNFNRLRNLCRMPDSVECRWRCSVSRLVQLSTCWVWWIRK